MKKLILVMLVVTIGFLLPGPDRVSAQERPPTKSELEKMMEELDPEDREIMKQRPLHGGQGNTAGNIHQFQMTMKSKLNILLPGARGQYRRTAIRPIWPG